MGNDIVVDDGVRVEVFIPECIRTIKGDYCRIFERTKQRIIHAEEIVEEPKLDEYSSKR